MLTLWSGHARRSVCASACLVIAALILVPALVRALQHWDPHQPIRTSIKLNWNGDTPRAKGLISSGLLALDLTAPPATAHAPQRVVRLACDAAQAAPKSLLDGAPDALRGPPATTLS